MDHVRSIYNPLGVKGASLRNKREAACRQLWLLDALFGLAQNAYLLLLEPLAVDRGCYIVCDSRVGRYYS